MSMHDAVENNSTEDSSINHATNKENIQNIEQESLKFPMTNNTSINLSSLSDAIQVPLGMDAHAYARAFAAEQTDLGKKRQVYLNTLAVYAVHSYLNWIEIESDLGRSDSWDALARRTGTATDLHLSEVQEKIECLPVLPGESQFSLRSDLLTRRMSCFPVVFGDRLDYVQLPGFAKLSNHVMLYRSGIPSQLEENSDTRTFSLDECFALEDFPAYQKWWKSEMPSTGPINLIHLVLKHQLMEEHLQAGMRDRPLVQDGALGGDLESRLTQLKNTFNIPPQSWGFCQDIQLNGFSFELMTAVWQAVTDAHWSVVFLLRDRYNDALPKGLHLEVKQPTSDRLLLSKELKTPGRLIFGNDDHPIDGRIGDRLAITISFDGHTEKLPLLVFDPI